MKERLVIGRIRTAFGRAGECAVESLSGESEHFVRLTSVAVRRGNVERVYAVESVRLTHKGVVMKLAGVDSPEAAAALRGSEVVVDRAAAAPLREGEYYYADLEGLAVLHDGDRVGAITAIWEAGPYPLLEIQTVGGRGSLVPFVEGFFGEVDLVRQTIDLLDLEVLE